MRLLLISASLIFYIKFETFFCVFIYCSKQEKEFACRKLNLAFRGAQKPVALLSYPKQRPILSIVSVFTIHALYITNGCLSSLMEHPIAMGDASIQDNKWPWHIIIIKNIILLIILYNIIIGKNPAFKLLWRRWQNVAMKMGPILPIANKTSWNERPDHGKNCPYHHHF